VAAVIEFRAWTNTNTGNAYSVWPTWGWICALVASVLWLLAASAASCAPTHIILVNDLQNHPDILAERHKEGTHAHLCQ
jgi:hypothetical protein